ncbi:S8 family peptidase [Jatrophihabitans sp. DSM 45814]
MNEVGLSGAGRGFRAAALVLSMLCAFTALSGLNASSAHAAPGPAEAPEWWFDAWQAPALWASGADGRGITVAVVDTGVQGDLPELAGKVLPGADLIGNGTDGRTDFDSDDFSHGTAMASLIAASPGYGDIEGLAPAAKILPISVPLRGVVRQGTPTANATSQAVRYAADHGAKIISMSLGGFVDAAEDPDPCPGMLQDAVTYALQKGALVVAASGNSGQSGSPVEEPGVCLGVISVGAVDASSTVTSFSSRHPYLTVVAPGDDIATLSKVSGRAFVGGGTSQATAITSAALAVIWSKFPTATNQQILSRLLGSVTDLGPKGDDDQYGLGLINPAAAINANAAASKPNVVFAGVKPLLDLAATTPRVPPAKAVAGKTDAAIGTLAIGAQGSSLGLSFYLLLIATVLLAVAGVILLVRGLRRRPRRFTAHQA